MSGGAPGTMTVGGWALPAGSSLYVTGSKDGLELEEVGLLQSELLRGPGNPITARLLQMCTTGIIERILQSVKKRKGSRSGTSYPVGGEGLLSWSCAGMYLSLIPGIPVVVAEVSTKSMCDFIGHGQSLRHHQSCIYLCPKE